MKLHVFTVAKAVLHISTIYVHVRNTQCIFNDIESQRK